MRIKTPSLALALALLCALTSGTAAIQSRLSPEEALKRAAENEEKLKAAEHGYTYRQEIMVQTFGEANSITAQLRRISDVTYDDLGNRVEKIIEYPPSPLTMALGVMKPDFKSLVGVDPFFLTAEALPKYSVKYVEREKIDEINTYVFDVESVDQRPASKRKEKEEWPFKGRVWIDDEEYQIVKVEGKALTTKDDKQRFPKFEYYREFIDGKYWLPSLLYAKDTLEFKRYDVPVQMEIKYSGYKKAQPRR
jgi:hypothetical protein